MDLMNQCIICSYEGFSNQDQFGKVFGNTRKFKETLYNIWKCPRCGSLFSIDPVDYKDIYTEYPLNDRQYDLFARLTLCNLLDRLKKWGLKPEHQILDYGCGNGLLIRFLKSKGYSNVAGYDPYVLSYAQRPQRKFDWIIANDVIEHYHDPNFILQDCFDLLNREGSLYIGMPDPQDVIDMKDLKRHTMRLHQPFHRIIMPLDRLINMGEKLGFKTIRTWRKSYMDTLYPFGNYRFLDELSRVMGHDLNAMFGPISSSLFLKHPELLFFGFFGFFFPTADEPSVIFCKLH